MKLTIITVVLNADADFTLTAESILSQDHVDKEWIVFDGASWSETGRRYLERYRDQFDQYISCPDEGVYAAMNNAVELASGDYVLFLNSGDIFYQETTLTKIAKVLDEESRPDILYGDHDYVSKGVHYFRSAGEIGQIMSKLKLGKVDGRWHEQLPCHQATFYRRDLFEKLQYDGSLRIAADHDLLMRAYTLGYNIKHVGCVVCRYYGGGFSAVQFDRCRAEWTDIYVRYTDDPNVILATFLPEVPRQSFPDNLSRLVISEVYGFEKFDLSIDSIEATWVKEDGLLVLATHSVEDAYVMLNGYSRFEQTMIISHNGREERLIKISVGHFTLQTRLSDPIMVGDLIHLATDSSTPLSETDGRATGWAFENIKFGKGKKDDQSWADTDDAVRIHDIMPWDIQNGESIDLVPMLSLKEAATFQGEKVTIGLGNPGHQFYGPYLKLPSARYRVTINFNLPQKRSLLRAAISQDPMFEISCSGVEFLMRKRIAIGTMDAEERELSIEFRLPPSPTGDLITAVEARLWTDGKTPLVINKIELKQTD